MIRCLKIQLKRVFSGRLLAVSLVFALLQIFSVIGFLRETQDVWYLVQMSQTSGVNFFTIYIFPALVFSTTAASEWNHHAAQFWILRSGTTSYTVAKILASAVAGFCAVFLGMLLFVIPCLFVWSPAPLEDPAASYEFLFVQGKIFLGYFLSITDISFSGAVVGVMGTVISMCIMSEYAAGAAPLVVSLTLSRIAADIKVPRLLDISFLMGMNTANTEPVFGLFVKVAMSLLLILVMTCIGVSVMKKRMEM